MKPQRQEKRLMGENPLAADNLLERFYKPVEPVNDGAEVATAAPSSGDGATFAKKEKPTHYKVVCISLYNEDIEHLESMVAELKRRGHTKANKSQLIRAALAQVDLAKIPKGF
jgi:hypothetical protein